MIPSKSVSIARDLVMLGLVLRLAWKPAGAAGTCAGMPRASSC
jgi:hypothetical protein